MGFDLLFKAVMVSLKSLTICNMQGGAGLGS